MSKFTTIPGYTNGWQQINPKPYHIELRKLDGVESIITEDDVHFPDRDAALHYILAWKALFIKEVCPDYQVRAVLTCNWTEECIYADPSEE